jgi:hypothetical protein
VWLNLVSANGSASSVPHGYEVIIVMRWLNPAVPGTLPRVLLVLAASVAALYAGLSEWLLLAALSTWPAHVLILCLLLLSACLPVYYLMRQYRKTLER